MIKYIPIVIILLLGCNKPKIEYKVELDVTEIYKNIDQSMLFNTTYVYEDTVYWDGHRCTYGYYVINDSTMVREKWSKYDSSNINYPN